MTTEAVIVRSLAAVVGRFVLGAITVALVLSMGGQLLLPALAPLHLWAARRGGPVGRVLWSMPPGVGVAFYAWLIAYDRLGEVQPWIWLPALLAGTATSSAMWFLGRPDGTRELEGVERSRRIERRLTMALAGATAVMLGTWALILANVPQGDRTNAVWALIPEAGLVTAVVFVVLALRHPRARQ